LKLKYGATAFTFKFWVFKFNLRRYIEVLVIEGNKISGSIPSELPVSLTYLDLHDNFLTGSIPAAAIADLARLQTLMLHNNLLSGPLPAVLGSWRMAELSTFSIMNNSGVCGLAVPALPPPSPAVLAEECPPSKGSCTLWPQKSGTALGSPCNITAVSQLWEPCGEGGGDGEGDGDGDVDGACAEFSECAESPEGGGASARTCLPCAAVGGRCGGVGFRGRFSQCKKIN
jgi:hypothetical protein